MRLNSINKVYRKKGEALRKVMQERGVRQPQLIANTEYRSRDSVRRWCNGDTWPQEFESEMEARLGLSPGFFQRIGAGDDYEALIKAPFASSRLAPLALRAVGDIVSEPRVYEQEQKGGESDMEGGNRHEAEELGQRVREALLMEPANPDVARVLRRHQDTLKGSVEALTELIFRVGKHAPAS